MENMKIGILTDHAVIILVKPAGLFNCRVFEKQWI